MTRQKDRQIWVRLPVPPSASEHGLCHCEVYAADNGGTPERSASGRRQSGFGGLVLQLRRSAGLSQEELAARAQLSVRAVRDIERGRVRSPQRRSSELLGAALGLSAEEEEQFLRAATAGRALAPQVLASEEPGTNEPGTEDQPIPLDGLLVLPSFADDLSGRDLELGRSMPAVGRRPRGGVFP